MGSNESKSSLETKVENEIGAETVNRIKNECTINQTSENKLVISGVSGDSKVSNVKQKNLVQNSCLLSAAIDAAQTSEASQELINSLKEAQDAAGPLAFNDSTSDMVTDLKTKLDVSLVNETVNTCRQNFASINDLKITDVSDGGIVSDITQANEGFNECVQSSLSEVAQEAGVESKATQETEKSQTASSLGFGAIGIIVVMIVIGFLAFQMGPAALLRPPMIWIILIAIVIMAILFALSSAGVFEGFSKTPKTPVSSLDRSLADSEEGITKDLLESQRYDLIQFGSKKNNNTVSVI